jgi:hypothetical protein
MFSLLRLILKSPDPEGRKLFRSSILGILVVVVLRVVRMIVMSGDEMVSARRGTDGIACRELDCSGIIFERFEGICAVLREMAGVGIDVLFEFCYHLPGNFGEFHVL